MTTNYDKVEAIRNNIIQGCIYTRQAKAVPRGRDPVEFFLTVSREGDCKDFAAVMTMLCRYSGVPARMVSGFLPGEPQDGRYIVREKHYHAWTEVFFPKIGWVPFDATERAQEPQPSSKHPEPGPTFMARLLSHGWLALLIGLLVIALIRYLFRGKILALRGWHRASGRGLDRPPSNVAIMNAYLRACDLFGRRGLPRLEFQTPDEYAELIGARTAAVATGVGDIMSDLTRLYNQYRYGADVASDTDVQTALQKVGHLKGRLHRIKL